MRDRDDAGAATKKARDGRGRFITGHDGPETTNRRPVTRKRLDALAEAHGEEVLEALITTARAGIPSSARGSWTGFGRGRPGCQYTIARKIDLPPLRRLEDVTAAQAVVMRAVADQALGTGEAEALIRMLSNLAQPLMIDLELKELRAKVENLSTNQNGKQIIEVPPDQRPVWMPQTAGQRQRS